MIETENKAQKWLKAKDVDTVVKWELPHMDLPSSVGLKAKQSAAVVTVVEEVIAAEKITVAEVEAIRESARIEGLAAGLEEGRFQGIKEGKEQGFAEGKEQGYQQGLQQGSDEINRLQAMFSQLLAEFETPLQLQTEQLEQELLALIIAISEAVIGSELSAQPELLKKSIQQSLQQMPNPLGDVAIRLNPADKSYIQNINFPAGVGLNIEEDVSLTAGSYCLQTSSTLVTYKAEERFQQVIEQLFPQMKRAQTDIDSHE